jgi:hypothetical protein
VAKQSIVAVIKAKPGGKGPNHGKTAHLPMTCSVKDCEEDFLIIKGKFHNRKRVCETHFKNPPQDHRKDAKLAQLKSMGLVW